MSRKASSEAARTSRASAPIATPSAPKPIAPPARATSQRAKRPQSSATKIPMPQSMTRVTTKAHAAASATFSPSSPRRETSPRTSRPNACSSRSSASMPEASRTVTNMSDTVTETATAKASSGVRWPAITVRLTASGWPTAASTLSDRPRLSMAICAKSMTCWTSRACWEPGGSVLQRLLERRLGALEAEDVELLAQQRELRRP